MHLEQQKLGNGYLPRDLSIQTLPKLFLEIWAFSSKSKCSFFTDFPQTHFGSFYSWFTSLKCIWKSKICFTDSYREISASRHFQDFSFKFELFPVKVNAHFSAILSKLILGDFRAVSPHEKLISIRFSLSDFWLYSRVLILGKRSCCLQTLQGI